MVGTLGKSLGSYGAYVLCDKAMAKYLINTARTLIFSTALPPPAVAAAIAALELLREQPRRVEKLQRNAQVLRDALGESGLPVPAGDTQIVPLIVGDAAATVAASERALERGMFAQAIRPPTVPAGTSRLRLAVMASHTRSELREAARVLAAAVPAMAREAAQRMASGAEPARDPGAAPARAAAGAAASSGVPGSSRDQQRRVFDGLATPLSAGVRGRFVVRRPPPGRGGSGMRAARGRGSRGCWAVRRWRLALMRS